MSALLAKSAPAGVAARTLVEHTADVIDAFDAIFGGNTSLTPAWLRFFRLDEHHAGAFIRLGRLAAFCHDWGKANDGFQHMLDRRGRQSVRHEFLSAVLMSIESVWQWLGGANDDIEIVLASVVGHHLKAKDEQALQVCIEPGSTGEVRFRWDDRKFQAYLVTTAKCLGLPGQVPNDISADWSFDPKAGKADLGDALRCVCDRLADLDEAIAEDDSRRRMLWAVRAALVCADSAGSGLVRNGQSIADWVRDAFFVSRPGSGDTADGRLTVATIVDKVVRPRLAAAHITALNEFQTACGDPARVPARALLMAPCGSGKTLAAWNWIAARCAEQPRRRAIFLYPTRGTATEGFRDYLLEAGSDESALVHGAADLDLDGILPDGPDDDRLAERRLFTLRQWPYRLLSATADQFLGFLQHGYGPTCHLPLLVDSVIVCDEVHSYDRGLFSALLTFLEQFDVPVLAMTATMLEGRRHKLLTSGPLADKGLTPVNVLDAVSADSALHRATEHPRYRVRHVENMDAAEVCVREALDKKQRVLWVANVVDRCQAIARRFTTSVDGDAMTTDAGQPLYCYHSRFRLVDRQRWHAAVVKAFKPGGSPDGVLAVTTQVCEMSLDLDADLVVTEWCPGTALVQRMGRCCRDAKAHLHDRVGDVIVYTPEGESAQARQAPYSPKDLDGVTDLIASMVAASPIKQAWLETQLQAMPTPPEVPKACRFVESGPWAASGEETLRDGDEFSCPALLCQDIDGRGQDDVSVYLKLRSDRSQSAKPWQADGLVVPVPKRRRGISHAQPDSALPPWLSLAVHGVYFKTIGFDCDAKPGAIIC